MGIDINSFIQRAEELLYGKEGKPAEKDGKLNTAAEISIFKDIVNKELTGTDLDEAMSFAEQMGLELGNAQPNKAPAKAPAGSINIDIDASTNVVVNIVVNQQIDNIVQANIEGGQLDVDALVNALKDLLTGDDITNMLESLVLSLFNQFADNINLNVNDLMEILKEILEKLDAQTDIMNNQTELLEQLYNDFAAFVKRDMEILEMMGYNVEAIYDAVKNIEVNGMEQLNLLTDIFNEIKNFEAEVRNYNNQQQQMMQEQFNAIMAMLQAGNVELGDIKALLALIKADTEEGNKISAQILEEIKNGNTEILNILNTFGEDIAAALIEIKKQIMENGEANNSNFQAILNALNNLALSGGGGGDVTINIDLSAIEKLLEDIKNMTEEKLDAVANLLDRIDQGVQDGNEISQQILDAINKYGPDIAETLNAILEKLDVIDQNVKEGNELSQKILDAINQFGPEVTNILNDILTQLEANGDNFDSITHLLNQILDQAKANGEENNANFQAVLEAIANIPGGGAIDLSTIEDLLNSILTATKSNGDDLKDIIANQDVLISFVQGFKEDIINFLNTLDVDMKAGFQSILDQIDVIINKWEGSDCNCDVDGNALMEKLQEILDAIKNHNCNCGNNDDSDPTHEGVKDDWGDVLGAPMRRSPGSTTVIEDLDSILRAPGKSDSNGINDITVDGNEMPDGKYSVNGKVYIKNGENWFNIQGQPVKNPYEN